MCGIAGGIAYNGALFTPSEILAADRLIAHRGPDGGGFAWVGANAIVRSAATPPDVATRGVLIHRRLAIIDVSAGGAQPKHAVGTRFTLVFNGEIYNYRELREELRTRGVVFHTESDTEVLLAAWAEDGPSCLERLEGMFAFAIWDASERILHLVRDPFGIKPLYYALVHDRFVFASELPAVLALAQLSPRLRDDRVFPYLRYGLTDEGSATLLQDVFHLEAAHHAEISTERCAIQSMQRFWSVPAPQARAIGFAEAVRDTRDLFLHSVSLHLRSDVPVGACLSGGIDSSAVVCASRHVLGPRADLHVFTFSSADPATDETHWARSVAAVVGAKHHVTRPSADELVADIDRLIRSQGEPFGSTSIFVQARVFELIRSAGLKVVLDGQGADEMLAGYANHAGARIADLLRSGHVRAAIKLSRSLGSDRGAGPAGKWLFAQYVLSDSLQAPLRRLIRKEHVPAWLDERWVRDHSRTMPRNFVRDQTNYLKGELRFNLSRTLRALLRYEDRNSMTNGIEARVPFLSKPLVNHFLTLPDDYLIGEGGETKRVFRAAMKGIVPDAILARRDKIGFRPPEASWLLERRQWVEESIFGERARSLPFIRVSELEHEWRAVLSRPNHYNSWLWRCLNLIRWIELFDVKIHEP